MLSEPCYNLAITHTASLYSLFYRPYNKDNVVELSPRGVSLLAASNEITPRLNRPSGPEYQSVGNRL